MKTTLKIAAVILATLPAMSSIASARCSSGEIANILCKTGVISQQQANTADGLNAALGNPVDHAAAAAANTFLPGSGVILEGGWQAQRMLSQIPQGLGVGAPMGQPPFGQVGAGGGFAPQRVAFGRFCVTPAGAFAGPVNPVGMPCFAQTPWGPAHGTVQ